MADSKLVGIIGLGIMGGAIARNLLAAGYRIVGHDIDEAKRKEMASAGVEMVNGAAAVAGTAETILTSLPKESALEATVREIAGAKLPRRIVAELSTFSLDDKQSAQRVLQEAGHVLLDCPLSGTGSQAKTKDLTVYASGDSAAIKSIRPVLQAFSKDVYDLGAFANGSRMKYVANLLVAINNVASAEAMVLGIKAGLDPKQIVEVIGKGAGNSRVLELRGPMMAENRYDEPTMRISTWHKDMKVIGQYATSLGVPTPLFSATLPIYAAASAQGHGDRDTAAVCAVLEQMAGVKRR
ncbi:MAG TPA: NAD(P)-dependent oxidoreductase [Alphaproteobacteria bacterium]